MPRVSVTVITGTYLAGATGDNLKFSMTHTSTLPASKESVYAYERRVLAILDNNFSGL